MRSRRELSCGSGRSGLLVHNRAAGLQIDFDRSLHAWPVARIKLSGRVWIEPAQETMQVFGARVSRADD